MCLPSGGAARDPKRPEVGRAALVDRGRAGCTGDDPSSGCANDPKTRTRQMNESFICRPCVWINDRVHLPTESSADVSVTQSERRTGKSPGTSIPLHVHPDMNGNLWSC
ncbi:unnamed protein product [Pleuronectes platessa]|uniref:Uncharacterized protein n=1 Tax=Pleuronectes platessa TaxID=8262 RepID=A0A9N7UZ92_PLEPL|nr:unnamed protein product [Pleuronectes platessa]